MEWFSSYKKCCNSLESLKVQLENVMTKRGLPTYRHLLVTYGMSMLFFRIWQTTARKTTARGFKFRSFLFVSFVAFFLFAWIADKNPFLFRPFSVRKKNEGELYISTAEIRLKITCAYRKSQLELEKRRRRRRETRTKILGNILTAVRRHLFRTWSDSRCVSQSITSFRAQSISILPPLVYLVLQPNSSLEPNETHKKRKKKRHTQSVSTFVVERETSILYVLRQGRWPNMSVKHVASFR